MDSKDDAKREQEIASEEVKKYKLKDTTADERKAQVKTIRAGKTTLLYQIRRNTGVIIEHLRTVSAVVSYMSAVLSYHFLTNEAYLASFVFLFGTGVTIVGKNKLRRDPVTKWLEKPVDIDQLVHDLKKSLRW